MIFIKASIKRSLLLATKVAASVFIGYCIYFDRKRRNAPDYKEKIRERRMLEQMKYQKAIEWERRNRVFQYEIRSGKLAFRKHEAIEGVEHFINAILICDRPGLLIETLHTKLTDNIFDMIINRLSRLENVKVVRTQMIDEISCLTDDMLEVLDGSADTGSDSQDEDHGLVTINAFECECNNRLTYSIGW